MSFTQAQLSSQQEQDHFPADVRKVISTARHEAVSMNAVEVSPEHLFFGVLAQDNDEIMETLSALKLNQEMLREQVSVLFSSHRDTKEDESTIPLSPEAHECMEWAISFATYQHASNIQPEHVLLGCIRHQRLQPLLALFLMNAGSTLPFSLTERSGRAYTTTMDQYIFSRIRQQRMYGISNKVLSSFERPIILFSDIIGFHQVKQSLQEVILFLRKPQLVQQDMNVYLYGLLLVGPAGTIRASIVHAIAGEANVPLLSLSLSTLAEMTHASSSDRMEKFGTAHSQRELSQAERKSAVERGRHSIHDLFEQAKKVAPCVLHIDALDILAQPEMQDVYEQWQGQLRSELDGCDAHTVMVATTRSREQVNTALLMPGRLAHTAILDGTVLKPFEADMVLCSACQQEIPSIWKYCGFCGVAQAKTCPQCGAIQPEVQGIHFCPSCGENTERQ